VNEWRAGRDVGPAPEPMTLHRHVPGGGWIAFSPPGAAFRIGAIGRTEQEAVAAFDAAWDGWRTSLAQAVVFD
jgi:hypothetical protein